MRIVHLIDHFQSWLGYQETYLPIEQKRLGHDVLVITSNRYTSDASAIQGTRITSVGLAEEKGVLVYRLPVYFESPTRAGYVLLRGLSNALAEFKPDVVHCHGLFSFASMQAVVLKRRFGYRLLFDNHSSFLNLYPQNSKQWFKVAKHVYYRLLAETFGRLILSRADNIVAIGEPERAFLNWLFASECPEIPIIRLGANQQHFNFRPSSRQRIRHEFSWEAEDLVVLGHAGTLRPVKELDVLLHACACLGEARDRVRVLLVGSIQPEYRTFLQGVIDELSFENQVAFTGHISTELLPDYLSAMDIAVWPGDISITIIEAMAVGLPIITTRTEYTEAVIEKYGAGVLFQRKSLNDLSNALNGLITNQEERLAKATRARAAIEQDLNWTKIASQFIRLYMN